MQIAKEDGVCALLKYDMKCEANDFVIETSANDKSFSAFGIEVPESKVNVEYFFDESGILRALCGRGKGGDKELIIEERSDGKVFCGTERVSADQLLLGNTMANRESSSTNVGPTYSAAGGVALLSGGSVKITNTFNYK